MHTASKVTPRWQPTALMTVVLEEPAINFIISVLVQTCNSSEGKFPCL